jgi:REP element-mobilizing transposase RayT
VPRQIRIEYPGAIYHVMSRGDRREAIVCGDADRELWLKTLGEACAKCDWQVHAYCLMTNHFHLVVETPRANLVKGMKWFLGTYTVRFNSVHRLRGHLFAGRYKSLLIDESDDQYLRVACDYVHLNPARAKLIAPQQRLEHYKWSSYPVYLGTNSRLPPWLRGDRLLGEHGLQKDNRVARLEFAQRMEARRREPNTAEGACDAELRRGWHLGGQGFLSRLLDRLEGKVTENHRAPERAETDEAKAERIIQAGLRELGWTEEDLRQRKKCIPEKVGLAQRVRAETTLSLKRVAERLNMGTWTNTSNLLSKAGRLRS